MILQGYHHGKPIDVDAVFIGNDIEGRPGYLERNAALALMTMRADARGDGVIIEFTTAFREMEHQRRLWGAYAAAVAPYIAATKDALGSEFFHDRYSKWCHAHEETPHFIVAKPGLSNHQGGTAIDIPVHGEAHASVYPWLKLNAHRYGFIRTVESERHHWEHRPS